MGPEGPGPSSLFWTSIPPGLTSQSVSDDENSALLLLLLLLLKLDPFIFNRETQKRFSERDGLGK